MTRLLAGIGILAFPFLEIAGFIVVGRQIGVLPTIGLILLAIVAGVLLLRAQGSGIVTRIRAAAAEGTVPGRDLAHGAMIMLAGVLLVIPGFISDIIGLLLFIPPVRSLIWRLIGRHISIVTSFDPRGFTARRAGGDGRTIDLGEEEFSRGTPPGVPRPRIEPN